ncbi:MAG: TROVE domain-containing protein [Chloroflexota bacterium]
MTNLRKLFSIRTQNQAVPQNQALPGTKQVPNSAGGFVWQVDDWARLDRFLILGSEGGTYYIRPRKLTVENAEAVINCIAEDGARVVDRVIEISEAGRAAKNDPALYVLAMCAGLGDTETRKAALDALPRVARIGTHLFHFLDFVEGFRGWGRGLRKGVAAWYNAMPLGRLTYQAVKYQQRDGWSHRDALRLAHPKAATEGHDIVFNWITHGWDDVGMEPHPDEALRTLWAFERAKLATHEKDIVDLLRNHNLPWEAIPSKWLGSATVWQALLPRLPLTATLRNLGRLTANGVLAPGNRWTTMVVDRLTDEVGLRRARVHPLSVLVAMKTYESGGGHRSKLTWRPVRQIVDALDQAYYLSFGNVEATNKRIMLALDVSGSMGSPEIAGMPGITPRVGAAAMAMVTARTEADYVTTIFSNGGKHHMKGQRRSWSGDGISTFAISPRQRLDDVVRKTRKLPFGGTDCALPMLYALERKLDIDAFIIYTDSETWAGNIHPSEALRRYRERTGIPAKLIVVGMVSNGFSIADPNDAGMMDVVGFDTATPQVMADFIRG